MKAKSLSGICAVVFSVFFLFSCGPSDSELKKSIGMKLEATPGITATVEKGVVTLSGTVEASAQKDQAETLVREVEGVKTIMNDIQVLPPPPPKDTPDQALVKVIEKNLSEQGFSMVKASVTDSVATITGDIKKSEVKKVKQIVEKSGAKKVVEKLSTK